MPTALCCSERFAALARIEAIAKGYPHLPLVVVPHPFGTRPADVIRGYAVAALPDIIDVLTTPVDRLAARVREGA